MNQTPKKFQSKHPTHKETILKFMALVGILVTYFAYMSWHLGAAAGASVALLSWSFFVLCTPVADGGFILAFPLRLLFKVKMTVTQVIIWFVAVAINITYLVANPEVYELSVITQLLHHILMQPYPFWSILIISAMGTFLSIYFGDEMMDVNTHKERSKHHKHGMKYRLILVIGLGILTLVSYYFLLSQLDIQLPT
ncbi:hypothetical protein [Marinicella rhabdoformis]|uniref:hypothetical protein n=1 Tax=Marinicella rhabdoformis TaxID=2580566 RepID=UPI0012AEDC18|nr:hypothetical protein [Marinicella rhabdoformis]